MQGFDTRRGSWRQWGIIMVVACASMGAPSVSAQEASIRRPGPPPHYLFPTEQSPFADIYIACLGSSRRSACPAAAELFFPSLASHDSARRPGFGNCHVLVSVGLLALPDHNIFPPQSFSAPNCKTGARSALEE